MKINFQIVVIIVFVITAILGVLVFAGVIPLGSTSNKTTSLGTVVIWGTVNGSSIKQTIIDFNKANPTLVVVYVQKNEATFNQDLLEAMVKGQGPDMFLLPDDLIFSYQSKISPISYQSYSTASFKSTFIGAGEVFLTSKGILAFPISIDPLMMYYNRSILDQNSIIFPPKYWDDFQSLVPVLTKKDASNAITMSTVSLGQFSNITNAKDILATIFMQTGNPIITEKNGYFFSTLSGEYNTTQDLASSLSYYIGFSDPAKNVYSWNRGLVNSTDAFSAENLVFYFGYASELKSLMNKNPNENFLVTPVPQLKNSNFKLTTGKVSGLAISSASKNPTLALTAATLMTTGIFADQFAKAIGTVPVRRDLLAQKPSDAYFPIFYDSALYAKSWLDPSPVDTDNIFKNMIDNVLSNNMKADNAISDANYKLSLLLNK